jgi:predicted deacetylase
MKQISLDFDDFSLQNNNLFYIYKLREQYPNFKVSMFYIPADLQYYQNLMEEERLQVLEQVRTAIKEGWLELIPHGLMHVKQEFLKMSAKDMELILKAYEEHFKELDLPYVKGFKAPFWQISKEAIKVLNKRGWFLAIDRNQPDCLKAKKNYVYNWSIDEPFKELKQVKAHGHISGPSRNNIAESMINLSQIPQDYQWKFISEVMK